ncbi:hypothetical protein HSIEG1_129 [Enterococcus sp. HSIEG1]|nr:hypothetical protein HSIEG1_129 [Enterococcus sp. HSIEG1]
MPSSPFSLLGFVDHQHGTKGNGIPKQLVAKNPHRFFLIGQDQRLLILELFANPAFDK